MTERRPLTDLELWCMGHPIEAARLIKILTLHLRKMIKEAEYVEEFKTSFDTATINQAFAVVSSDQLKEIGKE